MVTPASTEAAADSELWRMICLGSTESFEVVVRRYQSMVCAVAYNFCGNVALSEDVAQETFWTAWRQRSTLQDLSRLRPWLCGIARNLGRNAGRRAARGAEAAADLEAVLELQAEAPDPSEEAMTREQESIVWETLAQIPEAYREAMILFYREQQSVAEVAAALDVSEDAVKQRLSRGRGMLRERVADLVEDGLRKSRPGRKFTICVMTGLAAGSAGAKSALAAGGAGAASAAASTAAAGLAGGLFGSVLGLGGGWLGTWIPAQLAPTRREHDLIRRTGRRILLVSVVFLAILGAVVYFLAGGSIYLVVWGTWFVALQAYFGAETLLLTRAMKRLREDQHAAEPNETALRMRLIKTANRYRGRVFRSQATFLGLPLVDINVRDPMPPGIPGPVGCDDQRSGKARGWIAIGDDARGVFLAVGGTAWGVIAIGGRTLGVVSLGGVAFGLVSVGGLAVGALAIGGLGVGAFAFGGLAIGWQALGGGAIAWDTACGGGAVAWHSALGGGAFAHDFAVGADGSALHFNDAAAKALVLSHPLARAMDWLARIRWFTAAIVLVSVAIPFVQVRVMYRKAPATPDPQGPHEGPSSQ